MARNSNTPPLRFHGFTQPWEEKRLGELYTERAEEGNDALQVLSVSIYDGISDHELDTEALGKSVRRSADKTLYKHVYEGDVVLNMMRAWQGAIGVTRAEGMVSPAYITARPNGETSPRFMDHALRRSAVVKQMNQLSYGVTDFRKRLYWDSFERVAVRIPLVDEQHRIGILFDRLDALVDMQCRELVKLRQFKQGMLSKMFPNRGATVPEVRFPGFTDPWVEKSLGNVSTHSKGAGYSKADLVSEGTPIILYGRLYTHYESTITEIDTFAVRKPGSVVSRGGEVLVPSSGENAEDIARASAVMSDGVLLGGDLNVLRPHKGLDPSFLALQLSSGGPHADLANRAQGKSVVHLYASALVELSILVPDPVEQHQIAAFFSRLDELIMLQERKGEKLSQVKRSLLDRMYV